MSNVFKTITITQEQNDWLQAKKDYVALSKLVRQKINEEMQKNP
jgi:hypothetical protein